MPGAGMGTGRATTGVVDAALAVWCRMGVHLTVDKREIGQVLMGEA